MIAKNKTRIAITITKDLRKLLEEVAKMSNLSISAVVNIMIKEYIETAYPSQNEKGGN